MCALFVRCLVVHNSRIGRSIAVAAAEVAVVGAIAVVVVLAVVFGWPSSLICQPPAAAAADAVDAGVAVDVDVVDSSAVANMVSLSLIDAACEVVDCFVVRCSHIVAPAQLCFVNALVVPDMMIAIQQLMSLKNIQIHCLESGPKSNYCEMNDGAQNIYETK